MEKSLPQRLIDNADHMRELDTDYNQSEPLLREAAETLQNIEIILMRDSAAKDKSGNIAKDHFVGKAILLCRSPKQTDE